MRIIEDNPSRLVLRERSLWVSFVCFGAALFLVVGSAFAHEGSQPLLPAGLFAVFGLAFLRSSDVAVDKTRRTCTVRRRDMLRVTRLELGFDAIDDVLVDSRTDAEAPGNFVCRLSLATKDGLVPLSAVYQPDLDHYQAIRDALVKTLFPGRHAPAAADPVRTLLAAGRLIDAVALLRTRDRLGLTEARAKAEEMRRGLAA
ncbi:MAG TPA: hypothetical protein VH331_16435 [Allosphingosinicella sp.]|nr:hypothetical protein [Allosphingosinicella sp.]